MKIAISTVCNVVSTHFGRCPHFTIVDIVNGKVENQTIIENPGYSPGSLPQFFADKGIECIIAGGMGVKAQSSFVQYGIETVVGITGEVESVVKMILDGSLEGGESLCDRALGLHAEAEHYHQN